MSEIELEPKLRAEIDALHGRLDDLDHYALLGIPRDADRKAVKSAYYAYAARIHPDRHFGKSLGPYKAMMEAIFVRMTNAHDTLAAPQRREEYDEYLAQRDRTSAFEQVVQKTEERHDARVAEMADPAPAPPATPPPLSPEAERQRREALARRLLGSKSSGPPPRKSSTPSMSAVRPTPQSVNASMRPPATPTPTPYQLGVEGIVASARKAASEGDWVTASTRMRLAAKLDKSLEVEAERLAARAHQIMADAYVKQARYEELQGAWVSAAISWSKAAEGLPHDPHVAERAANALRQAHGDLHKAVRLAESAVRLAPNDPMMRLTLVEVYLDAGLLRRARAELDAVLRALPREPRALSLDFELKRRA